MKPAEGCSLFSDVLPKRRTHKPRVPRPEWPRRRREEKTEKRANTDSMTIEVQHKEITDRIEVLRPIVIRDGL